MRKTITSSHYKFVRGSKRPDLSGTEVRSGAKLRVNYLIREHCPPTRERSAADRFAWSSRNGVSDTRRGDD